MREPSPTPLAVARVGLGALFVVRTTGLAPLLSASVPDSPFLLGWPDPTGVHLGPVLRLPPSVVAVACVARTLAGVLFLLGLGTRPAGLVAGALAYLVAAQDPLGFNMTMHTLFLGVLVLACTDARSVRSSLGLVRLWVASIYVWAGIAKLRPDWMSGRLLAALLDEGAIHGRLARSVLASSGRRAAVAPAVAVGEIALGLALLARPTRRPALIVALAGHALLQAAIAPDFFGFAMVVLLATFLGDIGPWRSVFAAPTEAERARSRYFGPPDFGSAPR